MTKLLVLAVPAVLAFAPAPAQAEPYWCVLPVTVGHAAVGFRSTPTVCVPGP